MEGESIFYICMCTCTMQHVCSVLHMLIVCLDHATHVPSLHTCTVLVYHTYMYTHSIRCLFAVYHVPVSAVSIVTIEVALVALKMKLELKKMSATKLPSCVIMKRVIPTLPVIPVQLMRPDIG